VRIFEVLDPVTAAWKGLADFCKENDEFEDYSVSKFDYEEEGAL
jgi:actin-related protein